LALGDITIYSKDNGTGYPGDINYVVLTGATIPQILAGEPVQMTLGSPGVYPMASGTVASGSPIVAGSATTALVGVAASNSNESSSGTGSAPGNGYVSVTPFDEPITYLISTLDTATFFGGLNAGQYVCSSAQAVYDSNVGKRLTLCKIGGVAAAVQGNTINTKLGGTYYITGSDQSYNGCIVEELDVVKYSGKVRFSFRNGLSYGA